ncbi:hypothetical protein O0L34_g14112 [Tuta absoluta]|nr:hypothetical protein O0L34_g14112 [Tuta absoluta]
METERNQFKRRTTHCPLPPLLVTLYIICVATQSQSQTVHKNSQNITKNIENLDINTPCHRCQTSNVSFVEEVIDAVGTFTKDYLLVNKTEKQLENEFEGLVDGILSKDKYEIFAGVEIKKTNVTKRKDESEGRALFPKYSYEYRLYQKVKKFIDTHVLSINLSKAARFVTFRSFGLKKFFVPLLIGAQVFKSILLAMFLPSILGSFGKILGKGISQLSASSSQASYPPANPQMEEQGYSADPMGYETNPAGTLAYPQDGMYVVDDNDLSNVDMSRFGAGGQKVSYLPTRNDYYKNQMGAASNNYKVFQKIPASSMILSNYDPFYSPLLSRLDGIFARLGLAPSENAIRDSGMQIGGQSLSDVKLEACREQLICFMYASPAKYAPYSNLISAQLSR